MYPLVSQVFVVFCCLTNASQQHEGCIHNVPRALWFRCSQIDYFLHYNAMLSIALCHSGEQGSLAIVPIQCKHGWYRPQPVLSALLMFGAYLCVPVPTSHTAPHHTCIPPPPQKNNLLQSFWIHVIQKTTPPPPHQTKVTIMGKHEIYCWENLIGPFLVHKRLGTPPPPPSNTSFKHSPGHGGGRVRCQKPRKEGARGMAVRGPRTIRRAAGRRARGGRQGGRGPWRW